MTTNSTVERVSAPNVADGLAHDPATTISAFLIRIRVGLRWLDNLSYKVPLDFGSKDRSGLYYFTSLAVQHPVLPPYSSMVENVILPPLRHLGLGRVPC